MANKTSKNSESKREKFVRIAESRTNKILKMIDSLGNCSNTNAYEYTNEDVTQIFDAIESSVKDIKRKFQADSKDKIGKFSLKNR